MTGVTLLKPSMAYGDGSSLRERVKGTRGEPSVGRGEGEGTHMVHSRWWHSKSLDQTPRGEALSGRFCFAFCQLIRKRGKAL